MLSRKDIDTTLIALPDHWHALVAIEALRNGKDVYGEKPFSLTVKEGRAMVEAVKRYGRVWQTGSQQRSDYRFRRACELVRNGRLGKLHTIDCMLPAGNNDYGKTGERTKIETVPEGFDYEMWLGPAPWRPFVPACAFVNNRWVYDYSGGQLTDWGGHHPDIAQWAMGTEHTGPVEIKNAKATYPKDGPWETATDYYFEAMYENGVRMIVRSFKKHGIRFEGTDGWLFVSRGKWDAEPKSLLQEPIGPNEVNLYKSDNHYANFIDCVISRRETIAPAETAHRSITIAHLGNIAMKLGRDLKWDPEKEEILNDPHASSMLTRPMRGPWHL
jgi:predicted dehydrogenase